MRVLHRVAAHVRGLLRELSDQAGYERYLLSTGRTHSAAEWKRFTDRRYRQKYAHAKCC